MKMDRSFSIALLFFVGVSQPIMYPDVRGAIIGLLCVHGLFAILEMEGKK